MNSQILLYVNLGLGLLLVVYFVYPRQKLRPTKLNLKANANLVDLKQEIEARNLMIAQATQTAQIATTAQASQAVKTDQKTWLEPTSEPQIRQTRQLSIQFMYNGHDWEAHDVLGLPQGASLPMATEAYQKLLQTKDSSSFPFYEAAYNAILAKNKKHYL